MPESGLGLSKGKDPTKIRAGVCQAKFTDSDVLLILKEEPKYWSEFGLVYIVKQKNNWAYYQKPSVHS